MAAPKLLPDTATLLRHVGQGMTHKQIGELYGVGRQAVTRALSGATEPALARRAWPWEIQTRHRRGWLYLGASYYVIAQSKERALRSKELGVLSSFMTMMEEFPDFVVDYYPDSATGLGLRRRIPGHDDPDSLIGKPRPGYAAA